MTFTDTMPGWRRRWPRVIPTRDGAELPTPDAAHVDVHEIRSRVVADAAPMQRQGSIPQLCGRNSGYPNVDGHRLHVETVAGHAMPMRAEKFVAPRRAVAADDINLKIGIPQRSQSSRGAGRILGDRTHEFRRCGGRADNGSGVPAIPDRSLRCCGRRCSIAPQYVCGKNAGGRDSPKRPAVWLGGSRGYQPAGEDHCQQNKIAQTSYRPRQSKRLQKIEWPPEVA